MKTAAAGSPFFCAACAGREGRGIPPPDIPRGHRIDAGEHKQDLPPKPENDARLPLVIDVQGIATPRHDG